MKKLLFFLIVAMTAFAGCSEDDDTQNNNNNNNNNNNACFSAGSMSVAFDGANSTHNLFNNTLLYETQGGEQGLRLDIRTNLASGILVLSISNWDWQNPPAGGVIEKDYSTQSVGANTACNTISGFDYCDAALVTFLDSSGTTYASIDEDYNGFIEISENDAGVHSVSGSFNARLVDIFGTGDTIYTSGTFTDLCYTVLN